MAEMNRIVAGHGSGSSLPTPKSSSGGGAGSFFDLLKAHRQMDHEKWMTVATHLLGEEANASEHGRLINFHDTLFKHAQPGTELTFQKGDTSASYTKKQRQPRKPKTSAAPGPFSPVKLPEEPQMDAPATPAAATSPVAKPKKYAQRDPKTGKISGYAETIQKPIKPKKATPRKRK